MKRSRIRPRERPRRTVNPWGPISSAPAEIKTEQPEQTPGRASQTRPGRKPIPKFSRKWKDRDDVIKYGDREVCNKHTPGGLKEYDARTWTCYSRQYDPQAGYVRCCNCLNRLIWPDATFEHEDLRTPGKIDERVVVDGQPKNGASHSWCNCKRGSRRTKIWHGPPEPVCL